MIRIFRFRGHVMRIYTLNSVILFGVLGGLYLFLFVVLVFWLLRSLGIVS